MAARQEVTAEDDARTALQFLEHSDQEFTRGDSMQGSEKLWGAASHAVTAISRHRGWSFGKYNHRAAAADRLSEEYNDSSLSLGYAVARKCHANFYYDFMEDDELVHDRPMVQDFVRRIVGMVGESAT